jgi:adenine phosphoribosyltransferase
MDAEALKQYIRDVPDFPKEGILFRDITPLLLEPKAVQGAADALAAPYRDLGIERILGIESRGFLFGAPVAQQLGAGLVLVRKSGKLPWKTHRVSYALEYGEDTVEMHTDAVEKGQRVLIVDDLIATGGTAAATLELARRAGAEIVACAFLIELAGLQGRAKLDVPVHAVLDY